jgi:anti-sigma regulatory factor (Ser/Thr protein kinase)
MVALRPPRQLLVELSADFRALARLRDQLRTWLSDADVAPPVCEDLLLVATELCTNAIEATAHAEPIEVRVSVDHAALRLSVANVAGTVEEEHEVPELGHGSLQERGRGLAIVRSLVDSLAMSTGDGRTVVRTMQLL